MRPLRIVLLLILVPTFASGCSMFQWLAPHQLWKLNREPAMGGEEGYFSVPPTPLPPLVSTELR